MPSHIFEPAVTQTIRDAQTAAGLKTTKTISVDGRPRTVRSPLPSPGDWRDHWIYFVLIDRFNNPSDAPIGTWNRRFDFRQGGTFKGVQAQLGYLEQMGVKTLWLSPVLKNSRPHWQFNYHGYGQQDFLNVDERFASDGQRGTAERELAELIGEAHARGVYVVLDIVLNHTARVFDYVRSGAATSSFTDAGVMDDALGNEPDVQWVNGFGLPRPDWQNRLEPPAQLHADDAVWPSDLQNHLFFRRRGSKLTDAPDERGFVRGDFGDMRQLAVEYDATTGGQEQLRRRYGISPVLNILIRAHQYLVARYDFDGFRIDTVKYVHPEAIETFGNAMREFALTLGKTNFFMFGEVYDDEATIARFTGRNGGSGEGFGIDSALDFPLFFKLPGTAKGLVDVAGIRAVFETRKRHEAELLSSHGEAGRFFVSFLDNHDQKERIQHPSTPVEQVTLAIALLFTLQGVPSLYYGTEQGLSGTVDENGGADLRANESSREALWGKPNAFDASASTFRHIQALSTLRDDEAALRYGRIYFREASGNGSDFGHSSGAGGIVAFSRILADREILIVANTGSQQFSGAVVVDRDINPQTRQMQVAYSNRGAAGARTVRHRDEARFHREGEIFTGPAAMLDVTLGACEIQVLTPV
ncbi:MAG: alpha-amylase family glycosyl hydrolase [Steroidobacter sp.]